MNAAEPNFTSITSAARFLSFLERIEAVVSGIDGGAEEFAFDAVSDEGC